MPRWAFVARTTVGDTLGELNFARDRRISYSVRDPASASFTLDGADERNLELRELTCDLYCYRGETLLFRGRLGSTDDDLGPDEHRTSWSAVDYRGLLERRYNQVNRAYTTTPQHDIAWDLIVVMQGQPGGNLGITRGITPATTVNRTEEFERDTTFADCLSRFQDYERGFEYWIDPQRRFNCLHSRGVRVPDFPLAFGSTVQAVKRTYDTSKYANWVRVRGGRPETPPNAPEPYAQVGAPDLATRPEGRFALIVQNHDLTTQTAVDDAAKALLEDSLNPPAAYTLTLAPERWTGPESIWIGDRAPLRIRSGRLNIARQARVMQLDVTVDDEGEETIDLTVGHGGIGAQAGHSLTRDPNEDDRDGRVGPRIDRWTPYRELEELRTRVQRLERQER